MKFDTTKYPRNRLGLARWTVNKNNPLTARVFVNQLWQEIFGRGIVKSSGDFGMQGDLPTHPELLDWLAVDFMDHGWDIKRLVKQMVMSATYRQSAKTTPEKLSKDPENIYLSRGTEKSAAGRVYPGSCFIQQRLACKNNWRSECETLPATRTLGKCHIRPRRTGNL